MTKFLGNVDLNQSSGNEGGELHIAKPETNSAISGNVVIDVYGDRVRIFESTGTNRGAYIDLTAASTGVGSNLLGGGGATTLDGLSDVVITSPEEFQGLSYNGTSWVNSHIPLVSYVRNAESTTITTGTVVYLFGATGDHATVKRADKSSDTTSAKTIGVAGANITASNNGPVVTRGYVDGIDLSVGYTAGDILWLGDDGAFTTTKATAPDHLVFIGVVVRATNNGIIYVATQNGYELDELHNVSLPSPNSGEFLKYNGSLWVADAIDLGTDTTGNYMSGISGTSPVSVSHTPSEGSSATVSLASGYGDTQNPYASKTANFFLAAPNGSAGAPTFRAIVAADIPTLNQSTTGNAATATTLQTSRNINGVAFNGSADITVTAAAGTLTGTTLASGVTASSLTSVGTLSSLTITGDLTVDTNTLRVDSTNNRVGVNVTSPAHALDVIGRVETRAAATQDGVAIAGRAGGTSSFDVTITPTTLGADRTFTLPNVSGTAITTGNLTDITTVGTLSAGSIPATLLTGTVASARISGSYTGITEVGTLTNTLRVDAFNGPEVKLGDWDVNGSYGAVSSPYGAVLLGYVSDQNLSIRSYGASSVIAIGNGTDVNAVQVGTNITMKYGIIGTNSGNQNNFIKLGTGATDSTTVYGYTAYANLRTTNGYNVGVSWISTGLSSPSGFTPNTHALFLAGGTVSGDIRSNANNSTSYNTSSDYRLKRDVVDIQDGIERIRQLKPKRFKFINDPENIVFDGFLAHEVQDVVPVAVSGEKDAVGENGQPLYQQIDTSWMVALLTAGIKELDAKVLELQARIAVLESN